MIFPWWFLADLYLVRIWLGLSNKLSSLVFGQFVCLSVQSAGFVCFPIYRSSLLCLAAPTSPPLPGIIFQPHIFSELLEYMIPPSIACHKIILMKNRVGSKALQIPNKTNKRSLDRGQPNHWLHFKTSSQSSWEGWTLNHGKIIRALPSQANTVRWVRGLGVQTRSLVQV